MIDLKKLHEDQAYRAGAERKGAPAELIDELLAADTARRSAQVAVEALRAKANAASKDIGRAAPEERPAKIEAASLLKADLSEREAELERVGAVVDELGHQIPNPAHESVPVGGEEDFEVVAVHGGQPDPPAMDHAAYGEAMGWIDSERAVRTSGSRFAYVMGDAAMLEFALVQWVMATVRAKGFTPVIPPVLVREDMMVDAGFFPTDRHQVYEIAGDDLFLIGTSEVALAGLHRGERLDADQVPIRYAGFSSCFRREAGTYGKDTKGIFRVHQFDKVEMFSYVRPDQSWDELERIRAIQESIVSGLGLPYRVIVTASRDLGAPAAKKYDIEVWLPSEGRYRELTSCSNYTDYSARRLGTRLKTETGNELVHTLNGTASAIGRTLLNLFEHCQQPDGSFVVPAVLEPICGFDRVAAPG